VRASVENRSGSSAISSGLAGSPAEAVSWITMHAHQPTVPIRYAAPTSTRLPVERRYPDGNASRTWKRIA
jgi:hypothetical protein